MTPDHVRGRLSSDAGATSSSISSPTEPSSMPTLSPAPSLTPSPISTTSDNSNHRPFAGGLLSLLNEVGTTGLNGAIAIEMAERRGIHLDRQSVSSLLSRLKAEGIAVYEDQRYKLK